MFAVFVHNECSYTASFHVNILPCVHYCTTLTLFPADASLQALDVLSTVLGDYLSNLTRLMRTNSDCALELGGCAFADIIDQSLHQTGLAGGKAGLESLLEGESKRLRTVPSRRDE